jgi:hypothetical protein
MRLYFGAALLRSLACGKVCASKPAPKIPDTFANNFTAPA